LLGIGCGLFFAAVSVSFASHKKVHLDAPPAEEKSVQRLDEETVGMLSQKYFGQTFFDVRFFSAIYSGSSDFNTISQGTERSRQN
jgi:hypothetical protein